MRTTSQAQASLDAAKNRIYNVYVRQVTLAQMIIRTVLFFGTILILSGISRVWFGGSWVLDVMTLMAALAWLLLIGRVRHGNSVTMTPDEIQDWLDAGCPDTWTGSGPVMPRSAPRPAGRSQ